MLEDITELRTFVRIVAAGSLSAADARWVLHSASSANGLRRRNAGLTYVSLPAAPVTCAD